MVTANLSRRRLLGGALAGLTGTLLAACAPTARRNGAGGESPDLASAGASRRMAGASMPGPPQAAGRPVPALRPGARVAIIAPASSAPGAAAAAAAWVQERGLDAVLMPSVTRRMTAPFDYLAGPDQARLRDLHEAFAAPDIGAVWCLQGGFGSWRLLDGVDYALLRRHPKPFIGYSDITALHLAIQRHAGFVTFHGPMPGQDFVAGRSDPTERSLWRMVGGQARAGDAVAPAPEPFLTPLLPGRATGRLTGGNLALIASLIGSAYEIDTRDAILFIEDTNEALPRIDRLLAQLRGAGKFEHLRGVLVGQFTRSSRGGTEALGPQVDVLLQSHFHGLGIPVLAGWPSGHGDPNLTLPLGAVVTMDTAHGLTLEQAVTV